MAALAAIDRTKIHASPIPMTSTTTSSAATYFMDDPREAARLEAKVDGRAWAERYLRPHLLRDAAVLEIGCGPGHLLRGAAEVQLEIFGTGIDLSYERIVEARQRSAGNHRLKFACANSQKLPLPSDVYDTAWCRHLLEYLPYREQAVSELHRVLRPGGTVLLQDLDGQFVWHYPQDDELARQVERVLDVLAPTGFDPFVGRKLYHLAMAAGFHDLRVAAEPYHLYAGAIDEEQYAHWALKLDILRPQLNRILGPAQAREMIARFLDYLQNPATLTYSVLFTVTGRK
jgi:SAM-dependent methyltransferase